MCYNNLLLFPNFITMNCITPKKYKINNIEYVKVENDDNKVLMMPLKELISIDKIFSEFYNYPLMNNDK